MNKALLNKNYYQIHQESIKAKQKARYQLKKQENNIPKKKNPTAIN
jgi:hypothetical protein